jgi:hypothetical protein
LFVADILYLSPEGAPNVFFPPRSAFRPGLFADHHGHNFDACAPETLIARASVKEGSIVFPDGMSYRLLVLPRVQTMTPRLLAKIITLVEEGATVVGAPPQKSPSLSNYPNCDHQVRELAAKLWPQGMESERKVGLGRVVFDAGASRAHLENPLTSAQWIWSDQQEAAAPAGGTLYFTREISIEDPGSIETAVVTITADQSYHLSLNGRFIASGHAEARVRRVDISSVLRAGANRLTVAVKRNSGQSGLIASLEIEHRDGRHVAIETDRQWTYSATESGSPSAATELGAYNMAPWKLNDASIEQEDIYPSYLSTAELLEGMGVQNDFEADAPFRFIHRVDGGEDIYFIANGEEQPRSATCRFRVTGLKPEWWDAVTGEVRTLPEFSQGGGRTEIPIELQPLESGFVVFRKPAPARSIENSSSNLQNFPRHEDVATLSAPWQIGFDPRWGGPQSVVFSQLEDWSKRPEPGIRYYSGKATYKTSFDCDRPDSSKRYFLSLGRVANIASVKVNGRDLGVVWCEPWRLAIPTGLLQPHGNSLEIIVANLWINRLIRDSNLPQDKQLTWITGNPFHPDDALLESGLLGPVTLQAFRGSDR